MREGEGPGRSAYGLLLGQFKTAGCAASKDSPRHLVMGCAEPAHSGPSLGKYSRNRRELLSKIPGSQGTMNYACFMCKVHPCNSYELFCWRLQKFYCLSNIINLAFGIVGHARKWGFRRKSCDGWPGVCRILGLEAMLWSSGMAQSFAQNAAPAAAIELPEVNVVATSPLPGGGEDADPGHGAPCRRRASPAPT